jgi:hypothetical protein
MSEFHKFAALVKAQFDVMSQHELFTVAGDKDDLWEAYLNSFPTGTNPIYKERTEHDCTCCKQFIRNVANVVAIVNGTRVSVWDVVGAEYPYDVVATNMSLALSGHEIDGVFRTDQGAFGAAHTIQLLEGNQTKKWHHFVAKVDRRHHSAAPEAAIGQVNAVAQVLRRGLEELTLEALDLVVDLIQSNGLYRGEEHLAAVKGFAELKLAYRMTKSKDLFVWSRVGHPAARFRNTVIGTLVQDLSVDGADVDKCVRAFEKKVAPENYKRPTAVITPRMVDMAMDTIKELGLESALERRFARISDVSVDDVLFVDNTVRGEMKGGVRGLLMDAAAKTAPKPGHTEAVEQISIDDFMANIVPQAQSIDVMLTNAAARNFMSLTAPVHPDAGRLFSWDNGFAWSYDGNVTDSVKEKVKRAGGNVDAEMRVSLAWFNFDDLDIHVREPDGNVVYFRNKCGKLDVDMNAGGGHTREPVENVSWARRPADGFYTVMVNQYSQRETSEVGFVLEVEADGVVQTFTYSRAVKGTVTALELQVKNGALVTISARDTNIVAGSAPVEKWGVTTEQFVPVDTILASPNHWGGQAKGNKHWFFILKGCKNPEPARGIYNEFLTSELTHHRKVFEVLGNKTKCPVVDDQLSGVGFSSTRHDTVVVRVTGPRMQKAYSVTF